MTEYKYNLSVLSITFIALIMLVSIITFGDYNSQKTKRTIQYDSILQCDSVIVQSTNIFCFYKSTVYKIEYKKLITE